MNQRIIVVALALVGCATEAPYTAGELMRMSNFEVCYMAVDGSGYSETSTYRARQELTRRRCTCEAEWPMVRAQLLADHAKEIRRDAAISAAATYFRSIGTAQPLMPARPTGFLKRDYESGFNRICVYDELGSERAVTISSTQLCPLSQ